MDQELTELMERISALSDEELLTMVNVDSAQYRPEAITFAVAELKSRGYSIQREDQRSHSKKNQEKKRRQGRPERTRPTVEGRVAGGDKLVSPDEGTNPMVCPRCGTELEYAGTRRLHEDKSLSILGELGEMFKKGAHEFLDVYICRRCGRVELFVDGVGEEFRQH